MDCCVSLFDALFLHISPALPNDESTKVLLLSGLLSLSLISFGLVVEEGSSGLMLLLVGSLRSLDLILGFIPPSFVVGSDLSNSKGLGDEETLSPVGTDSSLLAFEFEPIIVCSDLLESVWGFIAVCWAPPPLESCAIEEAFKRDAFEVETLLA